jgi:hypothetical protein
VTDPDALRKIAEQLKDCCYASHCERSGLGWRVPEGHECLDSQAAAALLASSARVKELEARLAEFERIKPRGL